MVRFFHTRFLSTSRKGVATILALTLCIGYCIGSYLATLSGSVISSMMRTALTSRVSIVSLLPVMLLPFLFTAFAVSVRQHWLLIPTALFRSGFFGYLGSCILCSYGSSGWLVLLLFLFSDSISLVLLCWYWIRIFEENRKKLFPHLSVIFLLLLGIVSLDCHYISPFLVNLLS